MLFRSVENAIVPDTLPNTVAALEGWDDASGEPPGGGRVRRAAHGTCSPRSRPRSTHSGSAPASTTRSTGIASLFRKTGRRVKRMEEDGDLAVQGQFAKVHKGWADRETWATIKRFSGVYTSGYFLNAVDAQLGRPASRQARGTSSASTSCCSSAP